MCRPWSRCLRARLIRAKDCSTTRRRGRITRPGGVVLARLTVFRVGSRVSGADADGRAFGVHQPQPEEDVLIAASQSIPSSRGSAHDRSLLRLSACRTSRQAFGCGGLGRGTRRWAAFSSVSMGLARLRLLRFSQRAGGAADGTVVVVPMALPLVWRVVTASSTHDPVPSRPGRCPHPAGALPAAVGTGREAFGTRGRLQMPAW